MEPRPTNDDAPGVGRIEQLTPTPISAPAYGFQFPPDFVGIERRLHEIERRLAEVNVDAIVNRVRAEFVEAMNAFISRQREP